MTPAAVELQIALCIADVVVAHGWVGSMDSLAMRLMLATPMCLWTWLAVTQSIPQMISAKLPLPGVVRAP